MALHSQRQFTEAGPQPLLFQEVLAFLSLEGRWVPESQVSGFSRAIRALDSEYLDMVNKRQEAKRRAGGE